MFEELLRKITAELPLMQFKMTAMLKNSGNTTSAAIFARAESPVIYVVSIVDNKRILIGEFDKYIRKVAAELNEKNKSFINNVICVNILADTDISEIKKFSDERELETDGNTHCVWWYTDGEKLYFGKNQPSKVFGIEKAINKALTYGKEQKNDENMSLEGIHKAAVEKSKLKEVTKIPFATYILLAVNILIFICEFILGEESIVNKFAVNGTYVFEYHQWYRIFTYMFLHGGIEHIAMNSLSLYIYGTRTEKYSGTAKFIFVYIISGIAGGLLSALFNDGFAVGASGAIFGIIGFMLALCRKTGKQIDGLGYMTMLLIAIVSIGFGFADPQIDNFGHIGGFIAGFIVGNIMYRKNKE